MGQECHQLLTPPCGYPANRHPIRCVWWCILFPGRWKCCIEALAGRRTKLISLIKYLTDTLDAECYIELRLNYKYFLTGHRMQMENESPHPRGQAPKSYRDCSLWGHRLRWTRTAVDTDCGYRGHRLRLLNTDREISFQYNLRCPIAKFLFPGIHKRLYLLMLA